VPVADNIVAGTIVPVEIQAVNPATGQITVMKQDITVGEKIVLEPSSSRITGGLPYTVKGLLVSGHAPSDFLFEWYLDGRLDEQASGIGKDTIALVAPGSSGSTVNINLKLYDKQTSQLIGQALTDITVSPPSVEIKFVPEKPAAGDSVSAIATADGFPLNLDSDQNGELDATLLSFDWVLDGQTLDTDKNAALLSTITFKAGKVGDSHQVSVKVESQGPRSEGAEAAAGFETAKKNQPVATNLPKRSSLALAGLASLVSVLPSYILLIGVLVLLLIAGLIAYKLYSHSKKSSSGAVGTCNENKTTRQNNHV